MFSSDRAVFSTHAHPNRTVLCKMFSLQGWVFRAETQLSKSVARQTYPLDGGNASLAPFLRVQFEVPEGVIVPQSPQVTQILVIVRGVEYTVLLFYP